jgi:hypothetical protein
MEKRRCTKRFIQSGHFSKSQLLGFDSRLEFDRTLVLSLRTPDAYPAGNNVAELNGYNRRDIVVGIRVIRVTRA